MAGELIIKNGINVSGSIIAQSITGSFTGSFNGTSTSSSFATTSSVATFASTASFVNPLTQSVTIKSGGSTSATNALSISDSSNSSLFYIRNDGYGRFEGHLAVISQISFLNSRIYGSNQNDYLSINLPRIRIGGSTTGFTAGTVVSLEGSQTASSGLARGTSLLQTLVAAANNDVLVGLDINPTFTNGAFTGLYRAALRAGASNATNYVNADFGSILIQSYAVNNNWFGDNVYYNGSNFIYKATGYGSLNQFYNGQSMFSNFTTKTAGSTAAASDYKTSLKMDYNGNVAIGGNIDSTPNSFTGSLLFVKSNGNILIGTTTDPGYKLNVSGSGNFTNNLTVTGSLQVTGGITGSLLGTGSYATQALSSSFAVSSSRAVSASYAPSIPAFPYTGSAEVTGSLSVVGTTTVSGSIIVQDGSMGIVSTGTTNATEAFKVQNATPEVLFNVKDDGELLINTTKYASNGVLTNNAGIITEVIGYNGTIIIDQSPNPPIQIQVTNGIITNVL